MAIFSSTFTDSVNFKDFSEDYEAKVEIGFDSLGDLLSDSKQAPYLKAYLDNTFLSGWDVIPEPVA